MWQLRQQSCSRAQVTPCLKHLWNDLGSGPASRVFLASDYVDQQLLCLIAAASLALFKMERINDVSSRVIFGAARTVAALDAAPLAGLDMAPVLEPGGGLALYSRAVRISKVLPPSLVPSLPSPGLTLNQVLVTERFTLNTEH